jgi:hypothetical protein
MVIKYTALVLMLAAGILVAATDPAAEETKTSIETSIIECEGEADGEKCLKLCIVKKTDGETESKTIIIRDGEVIESEDLEELTELCEGAKIIKIKAINTEGETECKTIIIVGDGKIDCDGLLGLKTIKLGESGTKICIVCTIGDDGEFKAVIVHDSEVQKFEDRESFEEYLESHPELKIEVEDCLPHIEEPILEE